MIEDESFERKLKLAGFGRSHSCFQAADQGTSYLDDLETGSMASTTATNPVDPATQVNACCGANPVDPATQVGDRRGASKDKCLTILPVAAEEEAEEEEHGRLIPRADLSGLTPEERERQLSLSRMIDQKRTYWKTILVLRLLCFGVFFFLELALLPNPGAIQRTPYSEGWLTYSVTARGCGRNMDWVWSAAATKGDYFNPRVDHNLCMRNYAAWACMLVSRSSAAMMYICFSVALLSRCRFFLTCLQTLPYAEVWPFHRCADAHVWCGKAVLYDGYVHTLFHLLRFLINGDLRWFYSPVAVSGYYALVCIGLLCSVWWRTRGAETRLATVATWAWKACLRRVAPSWEAQWNVHMLWATFPVAMVWHRPRFAVYWAAMFAVVCADRLCERCWLTTRLEDAEIRATPTGTVVRFLLPRYLRRAGAAGAGSAAGGVEVAGAIVHLCAPKLSAGQWHPFSCFYDPFDPRFACCYVHRAGDWTGWLQDYARFHPRLGPCYVAGPMLSEFAAAVRYRNQLLVCTGTAVTPLVGLAQHYDPREREVTLVWVLRDAGLIPTLLPAINPATKVVIYYTARDPATGAQLRLPDTALCAALAADAECNGGDGFFSRRPTLSRAVGPKTRADMLGGGGASTGAASISSISTSAAQPHRSSNAPLFQRPPPAAPSAAAAAPAPAAVAAAVDPDDLEAGCRCSTSTSTSTYAYANAHRDRRSSAVVKWPAAGGNGGTDGTSGNEHGSSDGGSGSGSGHGTTGGADVWRMSGYPNVQVVLGRPKDLDALVKNHVTRAEDDPLAENVVAISTGVAPFAEGVEQACREAGVRHVRADASFG